LKRPYANVSRKEVRAEMNEIRLEMRSEHMNGWSTEAGDFILKV
jgi:hypothetical protein